MVNGSYALVGKFQDKKSVFPSNAAFLVTNQVLEVLTNEYAAVGSGVEMIKMKVEGIEETTLNT